MGKYVSDKCLASMENIADAQDLRLDDPELANFVRATLGKVGTAKRTADMLQSFAVNSFLSGTGTPIANAVSVMLQSIIRPTTYAIGAMTDNLGVTKGDRALRDVAAMIEASLEGFATDIRFLQAGWFSGKPLDVRTTVEAMARSSNTSTKEVRKQIVDALARKHVERRVEGGDTRDPEVIYKEFMDTRKAQGSKANDEDIQQFLGENYDYITNTWPDMLQFINIPTRVSVAVDEYGKARLRRLKVAEMASRKARKDADAGKGSYADLYRQYQKQSLEGVDDKGTSYREIQASFQKMQEGLGRTFGQDSNDLLPYESVKEFALDNTFQSKLHGLIDTVAKSRHRGDALGVLTTLYVPFIKTPWNIIKEGATYLPILPAVMRPKYMRGNELVAMSKDELIPRQILGASMFSGIMAATANGYITGTPKDGAEAQRWRDAGIQPQSILIGDKWVSYARIEPLATVFGLAADLQESAIALMNDPLRREKNPVEELGLDTLAALKTNIMSKTFMQGFANLLDLATEPDKNFKQFMATGLRPLSPALLNEVARLQDDFERQASTPMEKLQQRIPFFRESLPVDYGAYGSERKTDKAQAITGFYITDDGKRTPLQREVQRVGADIRRPTGQFKNVKLDNNQLGAYRQMTNAQVSSAMERMTNSDMYRNAPKSMQRYMLEKAASTGRRIAANQFFAMLRQKDEDFARKWYNELIVSKGLEDVRPLRE